MKVSGALAEVEIDDVIKLGLVHVSISLLLKKYYKEAGEPFFNLPLAIMLGQFCRRIGLSNAVPGLNLT